MPLALVALAVLVWGWVFLSPQSLFWDDWLQLQGDPLAFYTNLGFFWVGHAMAALMTAGPWAVKVVTLAATVTTALSVFAVSGRGLGLSERERWLVAAISLVMPLNVAHGSVGVLALYTTCLGIFFVAWWILVSGPAGRAPRHWRALLAALLFFVSFTTASLLVFVAIPAIHFCVLYRSRSVPVWRGILGLLARYWYLPVAPVLFWVLRQRVFTPAGPYANYNEVQLPDSLSSPLGIGVALCVFTVGATIAGFSALATRAAVAGISSTRVALLLASACALLWASYTIGTAGIVNSAALIVCVSMALAAVTLTVASARRASIPQAPAVLALIGTGLTAFAYLPYLLVGKQATFEDWESRHQLLLPFGYAAIIVAALALLTAMSSRRVVSVGAGVAIAAMAVAAASAPIALALDWRKQLQLIEALEQDPSLESTSTVEFTDTTAGWNFGERRYRFYEYTALLRAAYGGESRFGGDAEDTAFIRDGTFAAVLKNPQMYGLGEWSDDGTTVHVTIVAREGATELGLLFGQPSFDLVLESER